MLFPECDRVIYDQNPLEEVICQLRFPQVLKIPNSDPVGFQERVRDHFPLYSEKSPGVEMPSDLPPSVKELINKQLGVQGSRAYEFKSKEETEWITLSVGFVAISTNAYIRWEQFFDSIQLVVDALKAEYNPSFCTRIGLRYRDVIKRGVLELTDVQWGELLASHIAGELGLSPQCENIVELKTQTQYELDDSGATVMVRHGLTQEPTDTEPKYIIDADFFLETKAEFNDALSLLRTFNRTAGCFFRWCIKDRLHNAMGPQPVS